MRFVTFIDGSGNPIAGVKLNSKADYEQLVKRSVEVQKHWRRLPAPARGEIVRLIGNAFRENKDALGELVTLETGKIRVQPPGKHGGPRAGQQMIPGDGIPQGHDARVRLPRSGLNRGAF